MDRLVFGPSHARVQRRIHRANFFLESSSQIRNSSTLEHPNEMSFFLGPLLLAALVIAGILTFAFRHGLASPRSRSRELSEFWRIFLLWASLTQLLSLIFVLHGPFSFGLLAVALALGRFMGGIGATIMTTVVPPGRTFNAVLVGAVVGFGVPLAFFLTLIAVLPKNEATMGYGLAIFIVGIPSGIAGIIAGIWRGGSARTP